MASSIPEGWEATHDGLTRCCRTRWQYFLHRYFGSDTPIRYSMRTGMGGYPLTTGRTILQISRLGPACSIFTDGVIELICSEQAFKEMYDSSNR